MKSSAILFTLATGIIWQSCFSHQPSASTGKRLPEEDSMTPSSFQCEARLIRMDSSAATIVIMSMLHEGSALFYSVGVGDTIDAKYSLHKPLKNNSLIKMTIEERLKMNSEKPDFIITSVKYQ